MNIEKIPLSVRKSIAKVLVICVLPILIIEIIIRELVDAYRGLEIISTIKEQCSEALQGL